MPIAKVLEYEQFVEWSALPPQLRVPITQKELAEQLGVDNATLSDWKKKDGFWDEVDTKLRHWARGRTPAIIEALAKKAEKTGDPNAVKLWLQVFNSFVEESKLQVTPQDRLLEAYGIKKDGKLSPDVLADIKRLEGEYGKDDDDAETASQEQA